MKGGTSVTSIVGHCGRFMLPLENSTTAAFYRATAALGLDPSEVIAKAAHSAILAAKGGRR